MFGTLTARYSESKGMETYGYAIVSITDSRNGKKYRTMGGGYDMMGTVLGMWAETMFQGHLIALVNRTGMDYYGMRVKRDENGNVIRVSLDGACGKSTILNMLSEAGIELQWFGDKNGRTKGYSYLVK